MKTSTKVIVGALAVGAVGVAVGMLLAPDKGSETRKKLKGKIKGLSKDVAKTVESAKDKIVSKMGNAADDAKATAKG